MDAFITSHSIMDDTVDLEYVKRAGGMYAGICYSADPFKEKLALEPISTSVSRYDRTIGMKHFSIGHHYQITIVFTNISKMMAILLNSFTFYNTCERSGRYTNMSDGNPEYTEWLGIFEGLIVKAYPDMDPNQAHKLAMENARYTLPLFNKMTTMAYTTSYVQLNFICEFFKRFIFRYESGDRYLDFDGTTQAYEDSFYENLVSEMKEVITAITDLGIYDGNHVDNKGRQLDLFEDKRYMRNVFTNEDTRVIGRTYEAVNAMTYPVLADLIRHRTTDLSIVSFRVACNTGFHPALDNFYTPQIFGTVEDINERMRLIRNWNDVMGNLNIIRQGHTILVRETGRLDKFMLKAKERLCGRVQLEAMEVMRERVNDMCYSVADQVYSNPYAYHTLSEVVDIPTRRIKSKCEILKTCAEPCFFSGNKAFERKV